MIRSLYGKIATAFLILFLVIVLTVVSQFKFYKRFMAKMKAKLFRRRGDQGAVRQGTDSLDAGANQLGNASPGDAEAAPVHEAGPPDVSSE